MVVSPLTGELVPLAQMAEHMRVSLIDPKWKEQREAMLAKLRGSTRAGDDEIGANLVSLARHRPDVFGAAAGPGGGDEAGGASCRRCGPGILLCTLAGAWDACLAGCGGWCRASGRRRRGSGIFTQDLGSCMRGASGPSAV